MPFGMDSTANRKTNLHRQSTQLQAFAEAATCVAVCFGVSLGLYVGFGGVWAPILGGVVLSGLLTWTNARRLEGFTLAVAEIERSSERIESGEGFQRVEAQKLGRFADLGHSLNAMFGRFSGISSNVLTRVSELDQLPGRIVTTISEIETSANHQEESVEEVASHLSHMKRTIGGIQDQVENLIQAAETSSSSILEMGASVDEVARNATSLHESAESSTSAVNEMGASIQQVAGAAEQVDRLAEQTASSMTEMDRGLRQVGEHVGEASTLTERVQEGAERGTKAVAETIADIERIHRRSAEAKSDLQKLVGRISEVGGILDAIGEINDETKLLSLNAAIIAAQAGERGKAFLVVANHVKDLARRTASSTEQITDLIAAIQRDSDSAVQSMASGIEATEQGVNRSRIAGKSLESILESASEANARVAEIARATEEQAHTSGAVAAAAQNTSDQVRQISAAMSTQSEASKAVQQSSEAALALCKLVRRSTDEQRETGRYITESIGAISEMTRAIGDSADINLKASEEVSQAVHGLLANAQAAGVQVPEIRGMLVEMSESTQLITGELARLQGDSLQAEDNA